MISNKEIKKVRKNDIIEISTKYFKNKRYLVEKNQYSKEVIKVMPLDIDSVDNDMLFSISLPWEMIEKMTIIEKEYICYFLNHSSKKLIDQIKAMMR